MKFLSFFLVGCWLSLGAWTDVRAQSSDLDREWEYISPQASATPGDRDPNAHVVRNGETLYGIARQYGLSLGQLRALNRLEGEVIYPGQRLVVGRPQPAPVSASAYAATNTYERTVEAATPTMYSRRAFPDPQYATSSTSTRRYDRAVQAYGRSAESSYRSAQPPQRAATNRGYYAQATDEPVLNSSPAYQPQLSRAATYRRAASSPNLQAREQQARSMAPTSDGAATRRSYYQVSSGDDIFSVADQFGVSVDQLREWNKIAQVEPGKVIVVNQWRIDETSEAGTPNNLRQARMPATEPTATPTQVGTLGVLGRQSRSRGMEPADEAYGEYVGDLGDLWQPQPAQPAMRSQGTARSAPLTQRISRAAEPDLDYSPLGLDMARVPYLEVNTPPRGTSSRFFALHSYLPVGSEVQVVLPGQQGVLTLDVVSRLPVGSEIELGLSSAVVRLIEAAGGSERITLVYPE
jgi:LysM repeat protein